MRDTLSVDRINKLHPRVRNTFKQFVEEAERELDITLRVTQGFRTIKEQQALYDQGRTEASKAKKEKIVTMAKPGQSYHNYGLAIDVVRMDGATPDWKYNMELLKPIADRYGIVWGGTFKNGVDYPHFELNLGNHWKQLKDITKDKYGYPMI
jgi:LAS superfamily LD-carboxypeptidase LdcB